MNNLTISDDKIIDYFFSGETIRKKSYEIYQLTLKNQTSFILHEENLPLAADFVAGVIRENYPDLKIPYHCRYNHFQGINTPRLNLINKKLSSLSSDEQLKSLIDLTIVSVLLDAGAGSAWKYHDQELNIINNRSEGLALATMVMFQNGFFSDDHNRQLIVSSKKLKLISEQDLGTQMQVSANNPMDGLTGRTLLLQKLGLHMENHRDIFPNSRPSDLFSNIKNEVNAEEILKLLLIHLGPIWPSPIKINKVPMGDTWSYAKLSSNEKDQLVPFHKLSQWLSYSIIFLLEKFKIKVANIHQLTGLPEYRNGGLFLDLNVIELKPELIKSGINQFAPDSPTIIEWRALTICLLDKIHPLICHIFHLDPKVFTLPQVLEGGTWLAGRKIAKQKRSDGGPPINIISDGSVF